MKDISLTLAGLTVDFELARKLAETVAACGQEEITLISWNDRIRDIHSPGGLQCKIKGDPGWEVYGRNHGGRTRVSINDDLFVFIFA